MNNDTGYLTVSEVARKCPSPGGGHITETTVRNWMRQGVKGVVLESVRLGGTRCTKQEWLDRFFDAVTRRTSG